jgi:hypothetical protein
MYFGGHIAIDVILEKQRGDRDKFAKVAENLAKKITEDNINLRKSLGLPMTPECEILLEMMKERIFDEDQTHNSEPM